MNNHVSDRLYDGELMVKTFGHVDVLYNGQTIFSEKQKNARIKSLLQYFIIKKDKMCVPEEIISNLWPDNEYIDEKKVLHTYVHRLKIIISKDNLFNIDFSPSISVSNVKGSYQMILSRDVKLDTDVFTELARKVFEPLDEDSLVETAYDVMRVYDGHFMQDSQHEQMVLRLRNHYLQTCCKAIARLLTKLYEKRRYDDVIRIGQDFFALDDLNEEINLLFIKSLINTQQNNYAARHFNYIEKKMLETMGMSPPEEMSALLQHSRQKSTSSDGARKEEQPLVQDISADNHIRQLIEDVVNEKMNTDMTTYTVLTLKILNGTVENKAKALEQLLLRALRKNDLFVVTGDSSALAILRNAKEEHFHIIKKRLEDLGNMICDTKDIRMDISIWKTTRIV